MSIARKSTAHHSPPSLILPYAISRPPTNPNARTHTSPPLLSLCLCASIMHLCVLSKRVYGFIAALGGIEGALRSNQLETEGNTAQHTCIHLQVKCPSYLLLEVTTISNICYSRLLPYFEANLKVTSPTIAYIYSGRKFCYSRLLPFRSKAESNFNL